MRAQNADIAGLIDAEVDSLAEAVGQLHLPFTFRRAYDYLSDFKDSDDVDYTKFDLMVATDIHNEVHPSFQGKLHDYLKTSVVKDYYTSSKVSNLKKALDMMDTFLDHLESASATVKSLGKDPEYLYIKAGDLLWYSEDGDTSISAERAIVAFPMDAQGNIEAYICESFQWVKEPVSKFELIDVKHNDYNYQAAAKDMARHAVLDMEGGIARLMSLTGTEILRHVLGGGADAYMVHEPAQIGQAIASLPAAPSTVPGFYNSHDIFHKEQFGSQVLRKIPGAMIWFATEGVQSPYVLFKFKPTTVSDTLLIFQGAMDGWNDEVPVLDFPVDIDTLPELTALDLPKEVWQAFLTEYSSWVESEDSDGSEPMTVPLSFDIKLNAGFAILESDLAEYLQKHGIPPGWTKDSPEFLKPDAEVVTPQDYVESLPSTEAPTPDQFESVSSPVDYLLTE